MFHHIQTKNWKSKQYTPKSKITIERDHGKHQQNSSKAFQFAKTQTLNHIHNNNLQHRWWWASNGWSVKVCTDSRCGMHI